MVAAVRCGAGLPSAQTPSVLMRTAPLVCRLALMLGAAAGGEAECDAQPEEAAHGCKVVWREPSVQGDADSLDDAFFSALQDVSQPHRLSVLEAGVEQDANRLQVGAAASRRLASSLLAGATKPATARLTPVTTLLRQLADTLEADAVLLRLLLSHDDDEGQRQSITERYFELSMNAQADHRWTSALAQVAASAVRAAFARFAMLAEDPYDRFMALSTWIEPRSDATRSFCAPGTDPELSMVARLLVDDLAAHDRRPAEAHARRPLRQMVLEWLEAAHVSSAGTLRAVGAGMLGAVSAAASRRYARLVANARRADVLLAEELGGLKTPTGEADYARAAALLAPVELQLRDEPTWEECVDFVLSRGGPALKLTSIVRVQLLLAIALERTGRRAEAEALHKRGVLPLRETLPSPRAGRRSLHLGGVNHLESQRPLRSHAFWSLEQLPADQQAVVKALELQYHDIADEAFAALSDPKFGLTEENLAENTSHWRKFDIRRLGAVACFAWAVGGWWVGRWAPRVSGEGRCHAEMSHHLSNHRRGEIVPGRCSLAPTTCQILEAHAAVLSPMGQAKFSAFQSGSRIFPHAGPTNGRLRLHLGLYSPESGYVITVDGVNASWVPGEVLILDDSLEHEVVAPPAAGVPSVRIILIVDIHHPDLRVPERKRVRPYGGGRGLE